MMSAAENARRPTPTPLVPGRLPSTETGVRLLSDGTKLQCSADLLHPQLLSDSSGQRHGVSGCIVLSQ